MNTSLSGSTACSRPRRTRRPLARRLGENPASAVAISIAVHAAVFAGLMRLVWQDRQPPRRQIIAEAWLGPAGGGGGTAAPTPTPEPPAPVPGERSAGPSVLTGGGPAGPPDEELARVIGSIAGDAEDAVPAVTSTGPASGTMGLGLGGGGEGGSGPGSGFGVASGGPASGFFGQRGNAYKVVYVIDTSGSLGWIFEPVQRALIESIDNLRPIQSFHVIFAGSRPLELPDRKLIPAIAANKEKAKAFIRQLVPELKCDPVAAMRRAFEVGPELVYFLTDGDFGPAGAELLARLREWNADKRVHITTIGFGVKLRTSQYGTQPVGEPILRQIANEHGGNFRWVSPDEAEESP